MFDDVELLVLWRVTAELSKLDAEAQLRVLRYVIARLGLLVLLLKAKLVPDAERCEEIEFDVAGQ